MGRVSSSVKHKHPEALKTGGTEGHPSASKAGTTVVACWVPRNWELATAQAQLYFSMISAQLNQERVVFENHAAEMSPSG